MGLRAEQEGNSAEVHQGLHDENSVVFNRTAKIVVLEKLHKCNLGPIRH